jgi:hypothetical protein
MYVIRDEWDVRARIEHVSAALAEPDWWTRPRHGFGSWTLTELDNGVVQVRLDWYVRARRWFLAPLAFGFRPLVRREHDHAIAEAIDRLEQRTRRPRLVAR